MRDCWKPSVHLPSFVNVHCFQNWCSIFNVFPQIYNIHLPLIQLLHQTSQSAGKQESRLQCEEIQENSTSDLKALISFFDIPLSVTEIVHIFTSFIQPHICIIFFHLWNANRDVQSLAVNHHLFSLKRAALKGSHTGLEWHKGV